MVTEEDMLNLMMQRHRENAMDAVDKMVKYCRNIQREYIECDGKISGVSYLADLLAKGIINTDLYLKSLNAVVHYNAPYEITLQ